MSPGLWPRCAKQSVLEVAFYIDTSALVKLVVAEPETDAVRSWFAESHRDPVASDLVRTELVRAVRRVAPDRLVQARAVLDSVTLLQVTTAIFEAAGRVDPAVLRSLDALHVAAALELGDDLQGIVTYDERLAEAAASNGISVVSPN
jgi:predicted nucleic acid-binding protein